MSAGVSVRGTEKREIIKTGFHMNNVHGMRRVHTHTHRCTRKE